MVDPRDAEALELDEGNEEELRRHEITLDEVEQVWTNVRIFVPNRRHRAGDWKMMGLTDGGRALTIVMRYFPDRRTLRPITGWDSTSGERTRYMEDG